MRLLVESRVYLPYKQGNYKSPREEMFVLTKETKFCCESMREFVCDELSSSGNIVFKENTGMLVLAFHWHEMDRLIAYCPFCGQAITGEVVSRKTLKRVNKKVTRNDWAFVEVKED